MSGSVKGNNVLRLSVFGLGFRAAKERKKPDRVVFDCQERAYWVVHRPPVRSHTGMFPSLQKTFVNLYLKT